MRFARLMPRNSLRLQVLWAYLLGMVLSIALLVFAASVLLRGSELARLDLAGLAEDMAALVQFDGQGRPVGMMADEDDLAWIYDSLRRETAFRILDEEGREAIASGAGSSFWASAPNLRPSGRGRFDFDFEGSKIHGATEPLLHNGRTWYLQVAASTRLMTLLHRVALPLVATGVSLFSLVLLIAFGISTYFILRYALRPLQHVSESAAAIAPHSIHERLHTQSVPEEIAPLVDSFNHTLDRLERGYRVQQEFLGNAAHELKTPLALIRAQIELADVDEDARKELLSDVSYMSRQVHQLLLLAEASEVQNYSFAQVRIREVVQEVLTYLQRMAEAAGVCVAISCSYDDVQWIADRGPLFTLLKNLLENAIQHAPIGSSVEIEIAADAICVRDRGAGLDAGQLGHLFKRFWRAADRRDRGAGLGLSICQEVALAHGWSLTAEAAGPGLRFRLSSAQDRLAGE